MDKNKLEARLQVIAEEAEQLIEEQRAQLDLTDEERDDEAYEEIEARKAELAKERDRVVAQIKRIDRIEKLATDEKHLVEGVAYANVKRDPFDLNTLRWNTPTDELRSRAKTAVEQVESPMTDAQRAAVVHRLDTVDDARGVIPNLVLRTGNKHYRRAFAKAMAGRTDLWSPEERQAVAVLDEFRTAMGLTDTTGGFAIPFTLDPTLVLTNDGTVNPIRKIARTEQTTTDSWHGLTTAGATASWVAESTEATESTLTFAGPSISVFKSHAFIRGSIEITQDYQSIEADLGEVLADAKDRFEGTEMVNGAGGTAATGIITALDGGSSEVVPTVAETFGVADIYKLQAALPARYRPRASWIAELSTINAMRQFGTSDNYHGFLTDLAGDSPAVLLGKSLYESSDMDAYSDINAAETDGNNHILLFGDFKKYVVVDRIGMSIEFIPHLFATANNFPSGERGWYAHWRWGADSIDDNAFRVLTVATTA